MSVSPYTSLVVGYLVALSGWYILARAVPSLWPTQNKYDIEQPWRSLGSLIIAVVGVLAVGQLYTRGLLLPERGAAAPLLASLNQLAIFAPLFVMLWLRGEPLSTIWLTASRLPYRMLAGLALSILALFVYETLRADTGGLLATEGRIWSYNNLGFAAQVFLEDAAIAALCVRLTAAMSLRWSMVLVPLAFAASHIPAMISGGATVEEFLSLTRDSLLGLAAFAALSRSRDIIWFWFVHFTMDMTQFHQIVSV